MTIKIEAKVLAKAMKHAASVVGGTAILPILANVRLATYAGAPGLEITTSDLELEFRQTLPLVETGELVITVDAKRLAQLAATAPADAVLSMTLKDGRVTISAGRSRWVLPTLPVDDFPMMPVEKLCKPMGVNGADLAAAIKRVDWAICDDKVRTYLHGVYLHGDDGKARFVAANGNGMSLAEIPVVFPKGAPAAMLPTKYAGMLSSLSEGHDGKVWLAWDDRKVQAEIGDAVLTGKLIESEFVPYQRVIPEPDAAPVVVDPASIREALRRVRVAENETTRLIKIERGDGKLTLSTATNDGGSATEEIPADCATGHLTGINSQYLAAMADAIGGDTIEIHQADATAPIMVRRAVSDGALAVVMPMRL